MVYEKKRSNGNGVNERMREKKKKKEKKKQRREWERKRNLEERERINIKSSCSNILFKKFNSISKRADKVEDSHKHQDWSWGRK